ncbi:CMRF35-like molecule 9 [Thunnus albacares]|uniref:CMRF35-like molecule 9 n=1 Tax=Thunnus albacares TaxID=8236 RepID=UPI001CF6D72C|nr:CMRF35-like molecule 9 [Thunnus albacares]
MKVRHSLICFFLLSLINAEIPVHEGTEGGNITVTCKFKLYGDKKFFCKEECEEGNVLIETTDVRAQSGRYSIEYKEGTFPVDSEILYVSISQLTKSDSGRYSCGLDRTWLPDGFSEFEIRVSDAPTTSVPSASAPPGSFTPSSSSPETTEQSDQQQTDRPTAPPAPPAPPARSGTFTCSKVISISNGDSQSQLSENLEFIQS